MVETINKLIRVQRQLLQDLGREPTPEEIGKEMDLSPAKVRDIQKIAQEPVSLETPIGEEDEDRKSTRLNSSHVAISYAVFCWKKNNRNLYNLYIISTNSCISLY